MLVYKPHLALLSNMRRLSDLAKRELFPRLSDRAVGIAESRSFGHRHSLNGLVRPRDIQVRIKRLLVNGAV